MKVAIATVQVPFITGGAEVLVNDLKSELLKRNVTAEIVSVPFKWYPSGTLIDCMISSRMMDLTEVNGEKIDLVIAMKFPAYYLKHPNKVVWLMHQHRQAYDLWDTNYSDIRTWEDGEFVRDAIVKNDNKYLLEAKNIFTIAGNVSQRLKKFNNIDSVTLYPPPSNHEKLHFTELGDFIFYPSRIDEMKRQRLLVEAAKYVKSKTRIFIAGGGTTREIAYLRDFISNNSLGDKVVLLGYISEKEKIDYYAKCLAVYFGAFNEDYGYVPLESFFSHKPVIVHNDAGGPLEFVRNNDNGFIIEADAKLLAERIDQLAFQKEFARKLGQNGYDGIMRQNINWDFIISRLLAL